MATTKQKLKKYFEIKDSEVRALIACRVILDLTEYKHISENYGDAVGIEETDSVYKIPGFFKILIPSQEDSIDFFFPYSIFLNKTETNEINSKKIEIIYEKGDVIFYAKYKESNTDVKVLNSLFENGAKYLASKPDKLVTSIWQQLLPSSNVPLHHLELIVSQLYGAYNEKAGIYEPLRLTDNIYSKDFVLNTKQASHMLNNTMGFLYGHSSDALRTSVSRRKDTPNNFFENVISGDYDKLLEDAEKQKK